jgi:hypothetical protein
MANAAGLGSGLFLGDGSTGYPATASSLASANANPLVAALNSPAPSPTGMSSALIQALLAAYPVTPDTLAAAGPFAQLGATTGLTEQDLANVLNLGTQQNKNVAGEVANQGNLIAGLNSFLGGLGGMFRGTGGGTSQMATASPSAVAGAGVPSASYSWGGIPIGMQRGAPAVAAAGGGGGSAGGSSGGGLLSGIFGNGGIGGVLSGLLGGNSGGSGASGGTVAGGAPTGGGTTAMGGFGAPLLTGFRSTNSPQAASLGGNVAGSPPLNGGWSGASGPGIGGGYSFSDMGKALAANAGAVPPAQRRLFNYAGGNGTTGNYG